MKALYDSMMVFVSCNICGFDKYREICNIGISPTSVRSKLVKCKKCGFFYANPRLERETEEKYYKEQHYKDIEEAYWRDGRIYSFEWFLCEIDKFLKKGKLLDIGCSMGYFMDMARSKGWEVQGVEISDYAISYARDRFKLDVIKGSPLEVQLETEYFDAVTIWNVLDQLYDPRANLIKLHTVLKKGGYLFIHVPNLYFHLRLSRIYNRLKFLLSNIKEVPSVFHLYSFDKNSIKKLLETTGFSKVIVKPEPLAANNIYLMKTYGKNGEKIIRVLLSLIAGSIYFLSFGKTIFSPSIFIIAQKE